MANKPIITPPAGDLPENWTAGQTVAPAGPDVGLSQQHGYNYLMSLVNKLAECIGEINDAFSGLATVGVDGKIPDSELPEMNYIPTNQKGNANGVAELDANSLVPTEQIPNLNVSKLTSGILPVVRGGTGKGSFNANQLLYGALSQLAQSGEDNGVLMQDASGAPYWDSLTSLVGKAGLDGASKIQTGSYTGTGTYGASNQCSLTFDFVPQLVVVCGDNAFTIFAQGQTRATSDGNTSSGSCNLTWESSTVTWYSSSTAPQQNIKDKIYQYTAFG